MNFISHRGFWTNQGHSPCRQNSKEALASSQAAGFGIETDIRSFRGKIYLSHDPILDISSLYPFEELLTLWSKTPGLPLFLNVKEDGLLPVLSLYQSELNKLNVVFFDLSTPELVQYSKILKKSQLATRLSEYEEIPVAADLCDWVWVDGFSQDFDILKLNRVINESHHKVALVSSELHHREPKLQWNALKRLPSESVNQITLCTDFPIEAARCFS